MVTWNIELTRCRVEPTKIPRQLPSIFTIAEGRAQCFLEGRRFNATFTKRIGLHLQWQDADTAMLDEMSTALGAEFLFVTPVASDQTHGIGWGHRVLKSPRVGGSGVPLKSGVRSPPSGARRRTPVALKLVSRAGSANRL